eukprot:TRINITY_DN13838_c0_g1_i1.p1 TRINITY_DN13838_c0_g1~~TRINITY_DN13838_c0_g1_i1.p1  ORF type:complete len:1268 (+),score=346.41 TRINITY_DN13838_c0_g1_i1:364-3804(+)
MPNIITLSVYILFKMGYTNRIEHVDEHAKYLLAESINCIDVDALTTILEKNMNYDIKSIKEQYVTRPNFYEQFKKFEFNEFFDIFHPKIDFSTLSICSLINFPFLRLIDAFNRVQKTDKNKQFLIRQEIELMFVRALKNDIYIYIQCLNIIFLNSQNRKKLIEKWKAMYYPIFDLDLLENDDFMQSVVLDHFEEFVKKHAFSLIKSDVLFSSNQHKAKAVGYFDITDNADEETNNLQSLPFSMVEDVQKHINNHVQDHIVHESPKFRQVSPANNDNNNEIRKGTPPILLDNIVPSVLFFSKDYNLLNSHNRIETNFVSSFTVSNTSQNNTGVNSKRSSCNTHSYVHEDFDLSTITPELTPSLTPELIQDVDLVHCLVEDIGLESISENYVFGIDKHLSVKGDEDEEVKIVEMNSDDSIDLTLDDFEDSESIDDTDDEMTEVTSFVEDFLSERDNQVIFEQEKKLNGNLGLDSNLTSSRRISTNELRSKIKVLLMEFASKLRTVADIREKICGLKTKSFNLVFEKAINFELEFDYLMKNMLYLSDNYVKQNERVLFDEIKEKFLRFNQHFERYVQEVNELANDDSSAFNPWLIDHAFKNAVLQFIKIAKKCREKKEFYVDKEFYHRNIILGDDFYLKYSKQVHLINLLSFTKDIISHDHVDMHLKPGIIDSPLLRFMFDTQRIPQIRDLFKSSILRYDSTFGIMLIQLYTRFERVYLIIDTNLLFYKNTRKLLFSSDINEENYIVPLLEKALAKYYGSYSKLYENMVNENFLRLLWGIRFKVISINKIEKDLVIVSQTLQILFQIIQHPYQFLLIKTKRKSDILGLANDTYFFISNGFKSDQYQLFYVVPLSTYEYEKRMIGLGHNEYLSVDNESISPTSTTKRNDFKPFSKFSGEFRKGSLEWKPTLKGRLNNQSLSRSSTVASLEKNVEIDYDEEITENVENEGVWLTYRELLKVSKRFVLCDFLSLMKKASYNAGTINSKSFFDTDFYEQKNFTYDCFKLLFRKKKSNIVFIEVIQQQEIVLPLVLNILQTLSINDNDLEQYDLSRVISMSKRFDSTSRVTYFSIRLSDLDLYSFAIIPLLGDIKDFSPAGRLEKNERSDWKSTTLKYILNVYSSEKVGLMKISRTIKPNQLHILNDHFDSSFV